MPGGRWSGTGNASSTGSPADAANNWGYGANLATSKSNWSTTADGLSDPLQVPGAATDVVFTAANATGVAGTLTTQLDSNYSINSLTVDVRSAWSQTSVVAAPAGWPWPRPPTPIWPSTAPAR